MTTSIRPDPQNPNGDHKDVPAPSRDEAFKGMEEAKKNLLEAEANYHKSMARLTAKCKDAQKTLLGDLHNQARRIHSGPDQFQRLKNREPQDSEAG